MKVYIEKNGKFYHWHAWGHQNGFDTDVSHYVLNEQTETQDREFEIGAYVYLESYFSPPGWYVVHRKARYEDGLMSGGYFVPLSETPTAEYYVLNTRTQRTEVVHPTEESARAEAERIAKKHVGDTLVVLKVVGKAKATATVAWEDR